MTRGYGKFRPIKSSRKQKPKARYVSFRTGEQGWHRPNVNWDPSTRQLKALAIVFLIIGGIIGADQIAKVFFPNSPYNPVGPYDPFTLLWNGTVTGPASGPNIASVPIVTQSAGGSDQGINTVALGGGAFKFGECFQAPSSTFVYSFAVAIKKIGAPTGAITGVMRSGANPLAPRSCEGGTGGLAGSCSPGFDASTLTTGYVMRSFDFSCSPYAITGGSTFEVEVNWANCAGCDVNNKITVEIASTAVATQNGYTFQPNAPACANPTAPTVADQFCPTTYDLHFVVNGASACAAGYQCVNSGIDSSNRISLNADPSGLVTLDSYHPTPDFMFGTGNGTAFASFTGETFTFTGPARQVSSVQFLMNKTNVWTGGIVAQLWNLKGTPGVNGLPLGTQGATGAFPSGALTASSALTDSTVLPTNATAIPVTFTFPSSPIIAPGSYVVTMTENVSIAAGFGSPLIGNGLQPIPHVIVQIGMMTGGLAGHNSFRDTGIVLSNGRNFWFTVSGFPVAGVALTNSPIDVSTSSSKELLFYETWRNSTNLSVAQPWAWYITTNATLPTQGNYNPLNDLNVVMADIVYPNAGDTSKNYYEYLAKTGNSQPLFASSGLPTDPYPKCPQTTTLFICAGGQTASGTQFLSIMNVLNYTGNAGNTGNNGYSLFCIDNTPSSNPPASAFCSSSQATPVISPCTSAGVDVCSTTTLPFLNMQSGPYYLGFWSSAGQSATIQFGTSNSGAAAQRANSVWYWVPNPPPAVSPPPTIDTGGFFGPLIKALLGIGIWIAANIISFVTFLASVLAPLLATTFAILVAVLQAELNAIGGFFGWGNIGDQFVNFAAGIVTYFTTGLSDALGWLIRLILRAIDLIKIANFWVNFYLGGLLNILADGLNVIQFAVRIGTTITTFLGSSYVFLLVIIFLWYDADMGIAGWHAWFETVKWLAFISFDFLERMINFGISSITWIIGRIPTMDGTTLPELPTIAIGGGPIWPTMEMTALREGNVFALFGQLIGVTFLFWFETSGLPGSIGANVPASPITSLAPFINLYLIIIAIMGLVFVLSIPATLMRKTFNLDGIPESFTSRVRSGVVSTGGVSGRIVRKEKKLHIQINRGLGKRGLVPHLRRPKAKYTATVGPNIN